ncbi:MAG: zinc ribbon domain-containing protein [Chloroflexota bacterium]
METKKKIFHGQIKPKDFARALIAEFNHGNLQTQQTGANQALAIQISTRQYRESGGKTAITISIEKVPDGVAVHVGDQSIFGVAASLGATALAALRNPLSLITRFDDVAQDIESLKLSEKAWEVIHEVAASAKASLALSERLRRAICVYCDTPNPVGEPSCVACGAPLGDAQPTTCSNCGFVVSDDERICPQCKNRL